MIVETEAIVCALTTHGEHGGVVRMLTPEHGLVAAYVRGARGRRMRPVVIAGNTVSASLRSRTEAQLPQATIELVHSRAPILTEALPAAAVEWATALVTSALPERQPYPRLYEALGGFLDAVEAAPSAIGWGAALVQLELLLLAELGYAREGMLEAWTPPEDWNALVAGLDMSGRLLGREILTDRAARIGDTRARLIGRFKRAAG